jgi:hypothetical protein
MADRHILAGRKLIADQIRRIRAKQHRGENTTFSRDLLATMRQSLVLQEAHRENILEMIAGLGPTIHA